MQNLVELALSGLDLIPFSSLPSFSYVPSDFFVPSLFTPGPHIHTHGKTLPVQTIHFIHIVGQVPTIYLPREVQEVE